MKKALFIGAVLSISVLMCLQAGAISTTLSKQMITPSATNYGADTCISTDNNRDDDVHPRLVLGKDGTMVCVYEKHTGIFSSTIPVAYSVDSGETWVTAFEFDSLEFTEGSGYLQYPDILYNGFEDLFCLSMLDPFAEMYNNELSFIPGDIANAAEASWYGISGSGSSDYYYCSIANTDHFYFALTTEDGYGIDNTFGLFYFTYPDFESPAGMGGFYYDGQSEHLSAPAYELEMESGERIFITCETRLEAGSQITVKSTVNDEELLLSGEQQNGMDKWSDIEQYPGEYVAAGTDPDISSSGNNVCLVYVDGGNVKCAYSTFSGTEYDPGFAWQFSTVATGASAPSVYMSGNTVQCAYAKGGNVYKAVSTDKGATWGTPEKVNSVDGYVVAEPGSIDITDIGIVWTDSRSGTKDIYTAGAADVAILTVDSISGGFGVSAVVKNTGTAAAEDVPCKITIDAPLMILGGEKTSTIDVPAGGQATLKSGFILGFGGATITVQAGDAAKTATGTVLGPLVIGL